MAVGKKICVIDRKDLFDTLQSRNDILYSDPKDLRANLATLSSRFGEIHVLSGSPPKQMSANNVTCHTYRVREEDHPFFKKKNILKVLPMARAHLPSPAFSREILKKEYKHYRQVKKELCSSDYRSILAAILADPSIDQIPSVSVYIPTKRPENIDLVLQNILRQSYTPLEIVVGLHGSRESQSLVEDKLKQAQIPFKLLPFPRQTTVGFVLNKLIQASAGKLVVKMDDDDHYGGNYIRDIVLASRASHAPVIGKAPLAIYFQGFDKTYVRKVGLISKHKIVSPTEIVSGEVQISGATISGHRSHFLDYPYDELSKSNVDTTTFRLHENSNYKIAVDDGDQVLIIRSGDGRDHSWRITDNELSNNSFYFSRGSSDFWL